MRSVVDGDVAYFRSIGVAVELAEDRRKLDWMGLFGTDEACWVVRIQLPLTRTPCPAHSHCINHSSARYFLRARRRSRGSLHTASSRALPSLHKPATRGSWVVLFH